MTSSGRNYLGGWGEQGIPHKQMCGPLTPSALQVPSSKGLDMVWRARNHFLK